MFKVGEQVLVRAKIYAVIQSVNGVSYDVARRNDLYGSMNMNEDEIIREGTDEVQTQ